MSFSVLLARVVLPGAVLFAVACAGGDATTAPVVPTRLVFASTPDSALVGDTAALGATATDASGHPGATAGITYVSSDTAVARVSPSGTVRFVGPGTVVISAQAAVLSSSNVLAATTPPVLALVPAAQVRVLPTRVDAAPGAQVPLAAVVTDAAGNRIRFPLTYASDNATVANVSGTTLTAGTAGSAQITVRAAFRGRGVSTTVPVTIAPVTAGGFQIALVPVGVVDPTYAAVFTRAAAFWQTVITTALPSAALDLPADVCGAGTPAITSTTTGVTIFFRVDSIDGKGKILGAAGPCVVRRDASAQERGLTALGSMRFDSADFATLVAQGTAYDVVRHEMGHVLGIGTLWNVTSVRTLLRAPGTFDPEYTGPLGESGSAAIGFTLDGGTVPVENTGGPGTADAHWRSSFYRSELMTGYLSTDPTHPASRLTILSLADLGYTVNVAASEPYLPAGVASLLASRAPSIGAADERLTDVALPPLFTLYPTGAVHRIRATETARNLR